MMKIYFTAAVLGAATLIFHYQVLAQPLPGNVVSVAAVTKADLDQEVGHLPAQLPPIESLVAYHDDDYGFSMAVPEGWRKILTVEGDDEGSTDDGYAVGFESKRSHDEDVFADYIMIELLPGGHTGAFETDGAHTNVVIVDGIPAITDQAWLNDFEISENEIDLVVFQAEIVEPGYTIGIYVIGEQAEAVVLEDAFTLVLKTLKLPEEPFSTS